MIVRYSLGTAYNLKDLWYYEKYKNEFGKAEGLVIGARVDLGGAYVVVTSVDNNNNNNNERILIY